MSNQPESILSVLGKSVKYSQLTEEEREEFWKSLHTRVIDRLKTGNEQNSSGVDSTISE